VLKRGYYRKSPWLFSRNPDMKMRRRAVDFSGTKGKREENEERISMGKKANAFFFPGSYFLFPFLLFS
jgi:hypothetical protein